MDVPVPAGTYIVVIALSTAPDPLDSMPLRRLHRVIQYYSYSTIQANTVMVFLSFNLPVVQS